VKTFGETKPNRRKKNRALKSKVCLLLQTDFKLNPLHHEYGFKGEQAKN